MATIRVDADTLHTKANEIRTLKANHDENIMKMKNLITSMCNSEVFSGEASQAYINQMESMQATFNSFSEMIEKFATELDGVANSFTVEDNRLASSLNSN